MKLDEALEQLDAMAAIAQRTQSFDGFRWIPIASTSAMAVMGAGWQSSLMPLFSPEPLAFVQYWVVIAAICGILILGEMAWRYLHEPTLRSRRMTLDIFTRLLPSLAAGSGLTWVIASTAREELWMLPGLWSLCMGLGVFSCATMMIPLVRYVGLWYLVSGLAVLQFGQSEFAFHPLTMAIPFGVGQAWSAWCVACQANSLREAF